MAKITIAGDAMVITSAITLEVLKKVEKYRPKALCLYDTDDNGIKTEAFRVGTTNGVGTINRFGASFATSSRDGNGLATITAIIPKDVTDVVAYASDAIGLAVMQLNKVEAQVAPALKEIAAEQSAILDNIVLA